MADMQDFEKFRRMTSVAHFLAWEITTGEPHPHSGGKSVLSLAKKFSDSENNVPENVLYDLVMHIQGEYAHWVPSPSIENAMQ